MVLSLQGVLSLANTLIRTTQSDMEQVSVLHNNYYIYPLKLNGMLVIIVIVECMLNVTVLLT